MSSIFDIQCLFLTARLPWLKIQNIGTLNEVAAADFKNSNSPGLDQLCNRLPGYIPNSLILSRGNPVLGSNFGIYFG
jgi:hypothetical protein